MTHKSTYRGWTIPVGCTAVFHHDEADYAEPGYHLVKYWRPDKFWEDDGRPVPDPRRPAQIATNPSMSLKSTMRPAGNAGGMLAVVRFKCSCGDSRQSDSRRLLGIAEQLRQAFGDEAWIPLHRL